MKNSIIICVTLFYIINVKFAFSQKASFKIFDGLEYKNKPNLKTFGLKEINIIYGFGVVSKNAKSPNDASLHFPDESKIKSVALKAKSSPQIPVCLDVESWNLNDVKRRKYSINNYLNVLELFKKYNNISKVGLYGTYPFGNYIYQYTWGLDKSRNWKSEWTKINSMLVPLSEKEDIAYPSFYTQKRNDLTAWTKVVQAQVNYVRSHDPNKIIYGFIWPQYHSNNKMDGNKFIDGKTWTYQLETLKKYCDGIVIWGTPYIYVNGKVKYVDWDDNAEWWQATKQFMKKYNLN